MIGRSRIARGAGRLSAVASLALLGACATLQTSAAVGRGVGPAASVLDSIFADTALANAHIGALLVRPRTGDTLYARDAGRVFLPASNQKLVTGAVALETLGPAFRFSTTVSATGQVRDGVLRGDLVVRGGGDPTLSGRFAPDARDHFRAWADSLRARGITRVEGGIVGVDSVFPERGLGEGWAWDDLEYGFAAEYGALQFNEGVVRLQVVPSSQVGAPPVVVVEPPTQHVRIYNLATTGAAGSAADLSIRREDAGAGVTVEGVIPADTQLITRTLAVRDPTAFFLSVLRETLREVGLEVQGPALPAEAWPIERSGAVEMRLFTYQSPPLSEVLPAMMKPSQNQIAETLLLAVGRELRGEATASAGIAVVDSVMRAWNLPADELRMADGSGVSRYNLASPRLLVGLLARMDASAMREAWRASLPLAGTDGTLEGRMREGPLHQRVLAKTGTLTGVRTLSGYLTTGSGEQVVFSILVAPHTRSAAEADRVVEAALRAVAELH